MEDDYVDDLYILFSSDSSYEELTHTYNTVKNSYSSILKKHGLALNVKKCVFKNIGEINDELKKSLYDEYVNGIEQDLGQFFSGKLGGFLQDIYNHVRAYGITNEQYIDLIEKHFTVRDIEFTASEVYNYLVYENQEELKSPEISKLLIQIISTDITFLSIDPKRLSVMVMQSGNDNAVRARVNGDKELISPFTRRYGVTVMVTPFSALSGSFECSKWWAERGSRLPPGSSIQFPPSGPDVHWTYQGHKR